MISLQLKRYQLSLRIIDYSACKIIRGGTFKFRLLSYLMANADAPKMAASDSFNEE